MAGGMYCKGVCVVGERVWPLKQTVRILLECILARNKSGIFCKIVHLKQ